MDDSCSGAASIADKDQSYFLFSLTQEQLARAVFPVGTLTKPEVRAEAHRLGLMVADKADSQEICFVPDGDYAAFVESRAPSVRPGAVVNLQGEQLATHAGVHRFTVGQRKGLGISAQSPLYVLKIDADSGEVTVGPRAALDRASFTASGVNWIARGPSSEWIPAAAQIRHRHRPAFGPRPRDSGWAIGIRVRRAAARRDTWTGRSLLRRRHRHGWRLDRLKLPEIAQNATPKCSTFSATLYLSVQPAMSSRAQYRL